VHWVGDTDYPRRGRDIGPWIDGFTFLRRLVDHRDQQFHLGVWRRSDDATPPAVRPDPDWGTENR
jgi:hypothetical protein